MTGTFSGVYTIALLEKDIWPWKSSSFAPRARIITFQSHWWSWCQLRFSKSRTVNSTIRLLDSYTHHRISFGCAAVHYEFLEEIIRLQLLPFITGGLTLQSLYRTHRDSEFVKSDNLFRYWSETTNSDNLFQYWPQSKYEVAVNEQAKDMRRYSDAQNRE